MNFTREPIVETIISAKEGYKLSIKSSKHVAAEEYLVDAVEVVSFSGALFYRCSEKPKPFFLPIHDYEVQEVREAKLTIRSPIMEKSIKIGGGKEASRQPKQEAEEKVIAAIDDVSAPPSLEKEGEVVQTGERHKREKRQKYRRKRGFEEGSKESVQREVKMGEDGMPLPQVVVPSESVFSHLLKPPESLISDSIHKYKKMEEEALMSPEVSSELQEHGQTDFAATEHKHEEPELFSEPPREYERLEEDVVEAQTLIFSPTDNEKPQE